MAVSVYIAGALRVFTAGRESVELPGAPATLGAALDALFRLYPGLRDRVVSEDGAIRRHVNLFIGPDRCLALDAAIARTVELAILPAVSGGAS